MLTPPWVAASRTAPCPICGRASGNDDWCILIPNEVAICYRVQSSKPAKRGGWVHLLRKSDPLSRFRPPPPKPLTSTPPAPKRNDLHILAQRFKSRMTIQRLNLLASQLGLSHESLIRLDIGWASGEPMQTNRGRTMRVNAWSFPMRNAAGDVVGIRMRSRDGDKFSFSGGSGGLFIPHGLHSGRVYLVEGPTDTAAALDMGLNTFGRESCSAGVGLIIDLLKSRRFEELVIFSQRDDAKPRDKRRPELGVFYPAQEGAERLAGVARLYCPIVRVIMPPEGIKDVRVWLHEGGTGADVEREVLRSPSRKLVITRGTSSTEGARL